MSEASLASAEIPASFWVILFHSSSPTPPHIDWPCTIGIVINMMGRATGVGVGVSNQDIILVLPSCQCANHRVTLQVTLGLLEWLP